MRYEPRNSQKKSFFSSDTETVPVYCFVPALQTSASFACSLRVYGCVGDRMGSTRSELNAFWEDSIKPLGYDGT